MSQHVAGWPNASNMLRYAAFKCYDRLVRACKCWANSVGICCSEMLRSFDRGLTRKMFAQQCCDMMRGQVAIVWPGLYTQDVAPNNAAIWCVDKLRSFGRGFTRKMLLPTMLRYAAFKCYDRLAGACKCLANNVGICCAEMLRSFDRGYIRKMLRQTMLRYVAWKCCDRLAGALQIKIQLIARAFLSSRKCW